MKILLLTPPMTQLNTPYPATAYLTGFLESRGYDVAQADPAIELAQRLFSRQGLNDLMDELETEGALVVSSYIENFAQSFDTYLQCVEPVKAFLAGKDSSLAMRICSRQFLPEGPSFESLKAWEEVDDPNLGWAFGAMGIQDKAKHLCTLFLDDLSRAFQDGVDKDFSLTRYGERLAASVGSLNPMLERLDNKTLVDRYLEQICDELYDTFKPNVVGLSLPFPGNVLGGLIIAKSFKERDPHIRILAGGGYVNTELRELNEPRFFDFIDYVTVDDGERPILNLLEFLKGVRSEAELVRTFLCKDNQVMYRNSTEWKDIHHNDTGTPTYRGLKVESYLNLSEMLNPMHRIWSDGRWNKITLAHGCYWNNCTFCDTSLDYIARYQEADVETILNRMKSMIHETGLTGFHFVDEAAPPKILFALAKRIIEEGLVVSWWGNIRFEKSFTPERVKLLRDSGCIAVTGGLEVASNRLLKLMKKGVTVEQVAKVTKAFSSNGVLVHAYLMYGFPTQTEQETVDALERVRQLFESGCLDSAFWHRFAATVHSPIGKFPHRYGIKIIPRDPKAFAKNDLDFEDSTGTEHDLLGRGLKKALYNYMLGLGYDEDVSVWFEKPVAPTTLAPNYIASIFS